MILEWLRRRDAKLSAELEGRLFTSGSIVQQEAEEKGEGATAGPESSPSRAGTSGAAGGSLGIGGLKGGQSL
jgi:hypothetical protein